MKKFLSLIFTFFLLISTVNAQTSEVTVTFNEPFFDSLLDAIFKNLKQPDFPLAVNSGSMTDVQASNSQTLAFAGGAFPIKKLSLQTKNQNGCDEKIVLQREMSGVRTAVHFRDGRIYAPIAFSGSYNPPLVGCIDFQGYAETNIELEYDASQQALIGRLKVSNVQLGSVANAAGGLIARMVQNSIDKKINPIEILRADKLTFVVPIQNSDGALKLRATNIRHEIGNGVLNVHIDFEFLKAE